MKYQFLALAIALVLSVFLNGYLIFKHNRSTVEENCQFNYEKDLLFFLSKHSNLTREKTEQLIEDHPTLYKLKTEYEGLVVERTECQAGTLYEFSFDKGGKLEEIYQFKI